MNAAEASVILAKLADRWGVIPDDQLRGWHTCMAPIPFAAAEAVLDQLAGEPARPGQRRFLELAQDQARRQALGRVPRRHCQHCGGTGWREVEVAGQADAVIRCTCVPPPPDRHPRACTCSTCAMGPPVPDPRPERGPDPLLLAEPEAPGAMF